MCDVGHQKGTVLTRDFGKSLEIERARIGARTDNDQLRLVFGGERGQFVVIDHLRVFSDAVGDYLVVLAREIQGMTMGQVSAVGQIHSQNRVAGFENG